MPPQQETPILFIRHGEKLHDNNIDFDSDLTPNGKLDAEDKFYHLVQRYGIPDKIICSPYFRTRSTLIELLKHLPDIPCYIDPNLGEFINKYKHKSNIQLTPETLSYNPIFPESLKQFRERCKNFIPNIEPRTWYITHGFFITRISVEKGIPNPVRPNYLEGICINPDSSIDMISYDK